MQIRSTRSYGRFVLFALCAFWSAGVFAQVPPDVLEILESRGVDQRVNYRALQKFGPWDDRNYALTAEDLKVLSPDEDKLYNQLPAFFRVELRKEWPHLRKSGPAQYPRAALQLFGLRYGGLMQNGKIKNDRRKRPEKQNPVGKEVQLNQVLGANEITVEINPANPMQVIAGANNNGGQEMYYSTDGGVNWTIQGVLPNTCCDPTVDWSSDGTVAYVAALSGSIGVSFWKSFDGGQSWTDRVNLTPSGSDKEFIHVDQSPTSPHQDNIYVTYHNGNTMQFARSTDQGATFGIQAFGAAPRGIGSDITTTSNGDIYYAYGAFTSQQIILLKSTDGGLTFGSPSAVASTNGSFDFPIPSMESRRAWIYTAVDADRSGGLFDGSVYVAWTDTIAPENDGSAAANHTRVNVAYSRDGGATWNVSTPHPTADELTVDRWNQWMTVDEFGNVHVVYYDTRNSVNRTGVDLYYAFSTDGAVTWSVPERVSSATSANLTDGQEFGDYNGISVLGDLIVSTWTDNRDGPPNMKDVYADDAVNAGAAPGFSFAAEPNNQQVCILSDLDDITVSVGSQQNFTNPVTLNLTNLPAGFTGGFSANPVTPGNPPNTSIASISVAAVATDNYTFDIVGSATGASDKSVTISVDAFDAVPATVSVFDPLDGAIGVSTSPILTWNAAAGAVAYTVEVDDDPAFGSIDFTTQTTDTSASVGIALSTDTRYYWRVRAENPCGPGVDSLVFSFTTGLEICSAPGIAIPDGNPAGASDTITVTDARTISDLDVSLLATHSWVGDLIFSLTHVDTGTSVVLIDRPGVNGSGFGCGFDNIDAILDDDSATPAETACSGTPPALGGVLQPQQPLAAFNEEDLSGQWTLSFSDNVGQDAGTLLQWCLLPSVPPTVNIDSDDDGQLDTDELACGSDPLDAGSLSPDFDGDNVPDCVDDDDDNDGVLDGDDALPFDPTESSDNDGDGIGDNADPDDDNDGQLDSDELACGSDPLDNGSLSPDFDGDNAPDCVDPDDDNDGVLDGDDAFPFDPTEVFDNDGDGIGDNADTDDDNDGQSDTDELACGSSPTSAGSLSPDFDGDNVPDCVDPDDDNDGVLDGDDAFPFDPTEDTDTDGDGTGNNADTDDDNDGLLDVNDPFPLIANVAPLVSVNLATQNVQYSDAITDVVVTVTDADSPGAAISLTPSGAPASLSIVGGCTDTATIPSSCSWTVSGLIDVIAGDYQIGFTASDGDEVSNTATTTISVKHEDATVMMDPDNVVAVKVDSDGSDTSETFDLSVVVYETQPDTVLAGAAAAGDISNAVITLQLVPVGPGSPVEPENCNLPVSNGDSGYDEELTVTCTFDDAPVNTYSVIATVGGDYYRGSGEDAMTVYDPSLGFASGGGWFYWPETLDKTNFGFTMKYGKNGRKVKGSLLMIRHLADGTKYRVKSNALEGLAIGDDSDFGWASFNGKATYLQPGWDDPQGNYEFTTYVEDHNEPGIGVDRFWIEVRDKDRSVVDTSSIDPPAEDAAIEISGGNIVVPHGNGGGGKGKKK